RGVRVAGFVSGPAPPEEARVRALREGARWPTVEVTLQGERFDLGRLPEGRWLLRLVLEDEVLAETQLVAQPGADRNDWVLLLRCLARRGRASNLRPPRPRRAPERLASNQPPRPRRAPERLASNQPSRPRRASKRPPQP